jgi:hypothetical protein
MSQAQLALIRRASTLCVELELMETRFARTEGAKPEELEVFQRCTNSLRRLCECLKSHGWQPPSPARDLLLSAKHLFIAAMLAVPHGTGAADRLNHATKVERRGNEPRRLFE